LTNNPIYVRLDLLALHTRSRPACRKESPTKTRSYRINPLPLIRTLRSMVPAPVHSQQAGPR